MKRLQQIYILSLGLVLLAAGARYATRPLLVFGQSQEHHAGLVVQYSDGSVQQYCLAFEGESISGLDLLLKTGLDVKLEAYGSMGGAVCKIGHDGCDYPGQVCWCQSYGPDGVYWTYHHVKDGQWKTSVLGAGSYRVHDGEVEGWAWSHTQAPPLQSFAQICAAVLGPPTSEPPSSTRTLTRVLEPHPTITLQPRSTLTRTPRPKVTGTSTPTRTVNTNVEATQAVVPTQVTQEIISTQTATAVTAIESSATTMPRSTSTPGATSTPTQIAILAAATPSPVVEVSGDAPSSAGLVAVLLGLGAGLVFVLWRSRLSVGRPHNGGQDVD